MKKLIPMRGIFFTLAVVACFGLGGSLSHAIAATSNEGLMRALRNIQNSQDATVRAQAEQVALGGKLPDNWQDLAEAAISEQLKDPQSAQFLFQSQPYRYFMKQSMDRKLLYPYRASKTEVYTDIHGWIVKFQVNAKNSFGGYIGYKNCTVFFHDGKSVFTYIQSY